MTRCITITAYTTRLRGWRSEVYHCLLTGVRLAESITVLWSETTWLTGADSPILASTDMWMLLRCWV